ncbi:MAG: hypothetical protein FWD61_14020 [Phycisphaerales bacterium]|nr:hypothetical protein [Phycisphaerales bacterium]
MAGIHHSKRDVTWLALVCTTILMLGNAVAQTAENVKQGTVLAVDARAKTFDLKYGNGSLKFTVKEGKEGESGVTVITRDGKSATFADAVQIGVDLTVTYSRGSNERFASKVAVVTPVTKPGDYLIARTFKPGGDGRCGVMALDDQGKLLYVSRNDKLLVVNVAQSKVISEIPVKGTPRGVALVPAVNRGFITLGRDDDVVVFDLKTNVLLGRIAVDGDPSACVYDAPSKKVLVGCYEAKCVVPISQDIDLKTGKPDRAIAFDGRVTSIVSDGHGTAYVTVADSNPDAVALIETSSMTVLTKWPLHNGARPTGMSLDEKNARLFMGIWPNRFGVLSLVDGRGLGMLELRNTVESSAVYGDKVFLTTVEGNLLVLGQTNDRYEVQQTLKIGGGASTLTIDPKTGVIYIPGYDSEGWRRYVKDSFKIQVVEQSK